jgi:hypothetical protein
MGGGHYMARNFVTYSLPCSYYPHYSESHVTPELIFNQASQILIIMNSGGTVL